MANSPVVGYIPYFTKNGVAPASGYWIKGYVPGTTTPLTMYADATTATPLAKAEINSLGLPATSGGSIFAPHFAVKHDLWLFPTEAEADANDTTNASKRVSNGIVIPSYEDVTKNHATVAAMKADTDLAEGDIIRTLEHTSGYGYEGGNVYLARTVTAGADDNGSLIKSAGNTDIEFLGLFPNGLNICQWGADKRGTDDSQPAAQAAVDYLANGTATHSDAVRGGLIRVPVGLFRLASPLALRTGDMGVRIVGASSESSILLIDHDGVGVDTGVDGSPIRVSMDIEHLGFLSSATGYPAGSTALKINWRMAWRVAHCKFASAQEIGIHVTEALDGEIYNCFFQGPVATPNQGIGKGIYLEFNGALGAANEVTIRKCQIEDTNDAAILIHEGECVSILDTLIQSNERDGVLFDACRTLNIQRCYFEQNGQAGAVDSADISNLGSSLGLSANVNVDHNHFSADGSAATFRIIDFHDVRGWSFCQNDLRGGSTAILRTAGATTNGAVRDNRASLDPTIDFSGENRFENNVLRDANLHWTGYRDSGKLIRQSPVYAASYTPDIRLGRWVQMTLTGNITINAPIGTIDEDEFIIELIQDGTGGHAVTWDVLYRRASSVSITASHRSMFTFVRDLGSGRFIEKAASIGST